MPPQWDFYLTHVNDEPASIVLDLSLGETAPDHGRPWLLCVRVNLLRPRPEDGLPDDSEAPALARIEDILAAQLCTPGVAWQVGRVTMSGFREFFFYGASEAGLEDALELVLEAEPDYEVLFRTALDPEWDLFFDLLWPNRQEFQWIHDRRVVQTLHDNGDDAAVPRLVDHVLGFEKAQDREDFALAMAEEGFQVLSMDEKTMEDNPFRLHLQREDPVDLDHIHAVVCQLIEQSAARGGVHEGWGAPVVAAAPQDA